MLPVCLSWFQPIDTVWLGGSCRISLDGALDKGAVVFLNTEEHKFAIPNAVPVHDGGALSELNAYRVVLGHAVAALDLPAVFCGRSGPHKPHYKARGPGLEHKPERVKLARDIDHHIRRRGPTALREVAKAQVSTVHRCPLDQQAR